MAIIYKMSDVFSLSDDFKEKFDVLCSIREGEKLIIHEDKLCKDESLYLTQSVTRWWNQQNRYDIVQLLEKEMEAYLSFLKFVYGAHKSSKTAPRERKQLLNIYKSHKSFISHIVTGLGCMSITYSNTADIHNRLAQLIRDLQYLP